MTDRTLLISGNWKMHHNHYEALQLVQKLAAIFRAAPIPSGRETSVHPPFTSIRSVQTALESDAIPLALGAQDCHAEDRGAFTGEVSAEMLAKLNVRYVIVGHSERRSYAGETDEVVRAKIDAVLRHQMTPVVCVGESLLEREGGEADAKVSRQLGAALARRKPDVVGSLVIAYEPIWAIGTGRTASPADAQQMAAHIRADVSKLAGPAAAAAVRLQYGGSVTPENAAEVLRCPDVDGLLVGGASLEAEPFSQIVRAGAR